MYQHSHTQLIESDLKIVKRLYKQENNIPSVHKCRRFSHKPRRL